MKLERSWRLRICWLVSRSFCNWMLSTSWSGNLRLWRCLIDKHATERDYWWLLENAEHLTAINHERPRSRWFAVCITFALISCGGFVLLNFNWIILLHTPFSMENAARKQLIKPSNYLRSIAHAAQQQYRIIFYVETRAHGKEKYGKHKSSGSN